MWGKLGLTVYDVGHIGVDCLKCGANWGLTDIANIISLLAHDKLFPILILTHLLCHFIERQVQGLHSCLESVDRNCIHVWKKC